MKLLLSASLLILSFTAKAEVLYVSDTGFIVNNTYEVSSTPAEIWDALVNHVDRWWPADHSWFGDSGNFSIEQRAGGCFCEIQGANQVMHMQVAVLVPEQLLRMTGGLGPMQEMGMSGTMDFAISDLGAARQVTLKYTVSGIAPDGLEELAPVVDFVQGQQLGGLINYLSL